MLVGAFIAFPHFFDLYNVQRPNVRLGWRPRWSATFFIDNVFDKIGQTGLPVAISADLPTTRRIAISRPCTAGVKVEASF